MSDEKIGYILYSPNAFSHIREDLSELSHHYGCAQKTGAVAENTLAWAAVQMRSNTYAGMRFVSANLLNTFKPDIPFEEFYPSLYIGRVSDDQKRVSFPHGAIRGVALRPYDVVIDPKGHVLFGHGNIGELLNGPAPEILEKRRAEKQGNAPMVVAHQEKGKFAGSPVHTYP